MKTQDRSKHRLRIIRQIIEETGVRVEEHTIRTGPYNTNYFMAGEGPPLILLHGAGGGGLFWYKMFLFLSEHFRIIAPDIIGYGFSDKPKASYDKKFFSGWLHLFIEKLKVKDFSLAGSSQGGSIAIQYCLDHPGSIKNLILIDPGGIMHKIPSKVILYMMLAQFFKKSRFSRKLEKMLIHQPNKSDILYKKYVDEISKTEGARRAFMLGKGKVVAIYPNRDLNAIACNTLIIWGENDLLFPLSNAARAVENINNASLKVIPECGHLPPLEAPFLCSKLIINFCRNHETAR